MSINGLGSGMNYGGYNPRPQKPGPPIEPGKVPTDNYPKSPFSFNRPNGIGIHGNYNKPVR